LQIAEAGVEHAERFGEGEAATVAFGVVEASVDQSALRATTSVGSLGQPWQRVVAA
jgi:hypothetical protein